MKALQPIVLLENLRSIVSFHLFLCIIDILVEIWENFFSRKYYFIKETLYVFS